MISGIAVKEDDKGILRVVTRIRNKGENLNFKEPVILPSKHFLIEQMISELHRSYCHAGVQFLMSKLRQQFWIIHGRRTIRSVVRKCVRCRRFDASKVEVVPSALPEYRTSVGRPFKTTGIDLAGPLLLQNKKKVWIVIFTCAVYRCVHLDLVTSLSTPVFLRCLERFIYSDGRPDDIVTDNGTNFVGASNLLKEVNLKGEVSRINWTFNPPTAAWWGGWWERLIRTVKDLLKRSLGTAKLSYDELRTSLAAVTYIMNARPLTTVTGDVDDLVPLTPEMFRRGLSVQTEGFMESSKIKITDAELRVRHKRMEHLKQHLRTRFRHEYLSQLLMRAKAKKTSSLKVNDIVFVGSDNRKRIFWPLGRIMELFPGRDGHVRVAKVRTANGVLIRPLQRLYPMEVTNEDRPEVPTVVKALAKDHGEEFWDSKGAKNNMPEDIKSRDSKGAKKNVPEELNRVTRSGRAIKKPAYFSP